LRHTKFKLYPDYHGISGLVEMGMYAISFCEEWRMEIPSNLIIEFLPETRDIVYLALLFFKEDASEGCKAAVELVIKKQSQIGA
jgi:hypothetical protein